MKAGISKQDGADEQKIEGRRTEADGPEAGQTSGAALEGSG